MAIPKKLEIIKNDETGEFLFGTGEGDGSLENPIKFIGLTEKLSDEIVRRYNAFDGLLAACKYAKSQIKNGSPKKALPILRAAIATAEKKE